MVCYLLQNIVTIISPVDVTIDTPILELEAFPDLECLMEYVMEPPDLESDLESMEFDGVSSGLSNLDSPNLDSPELDSDGKFGVGNSGELELLFAQFPAAYAL